MKWTLLKLDTTSGYLHACPIEFAAGLNCIIGARGTCKSTIVETIRFVFNCDPEKIATMTTSSNPEWTRPGRWPGRAFWLETLAGGTAKCGHRRRRPRPNAIRRRAERPARPPAFTGTASSRPATRQCSTASKYSRKATCRRSPSGRDQPAWALIDRRNPCRRVGELSAKCERGNRLVSKTPWKRDSQEQSRHRIPSGQGCHP